MSSSSNRKDAGSEPGLGQPGEVIRFDNSGQVDLSDYLDRLLARNLQEQDADLETFMRSFSEGNPAANDAMRTAAFAALHRMQRRTEGGLSGQNSSSVSGGSSTDGEDAEDYPTQEILKAVREAIAAWAAEERKASGKRSPTGGGDQEPQPRTPLRTPEYPMHTSQEWTAVLQAATDAKYDLHYTSDAESLTRIHARPNAPFHTRIGLLDEERAAGYGVDLLKSLTERLDIDAAFALLYVSHCLAPPAPLPDHAYAGGWIDLNDVANKIGLRADTAEQAEANRRLVWDYIRFGARASIVGSRTTTYRDPVTGKVVDTQIDTPLWTVLSREKPTQPPLFDEETVPVRVELVASREWTRLTTAPVTAQYLPLGEVLGAIPGKKPSGARARAVGLAFMPFCRRNPREALEGTLLRPTREELLSQFPANETPYLSFLDSQNPASKNPTRMLKYWAEACQWLVDAEILAPEGEAARSESDLRTALKGRQGWVKSWLVPGAAAAKPRRRGRPRKRSDDA